MIRKQSLSVLIGLAVGIGTAAAAEKPAAAPEVLEVYGLIRTNLVGMEKAEIDRQAVEALASAFGPRVSLDGQHEEVAGSVTKSELLGDHYPYIRIGGVAQGLSKEVRRVYDDFAASNRIQGVVLDLRYADGHNFEAAGAVADLFVSEEKKLLSYGKGTASSRAKNNAITVPVAVIVNRETAGAAEALAAVLRSVGRGLILGGETAGEAATGTRFKLSNGQLLEVATGPVVLGDGKELGVEGVRPDIRVRVKAEDERVYFADPYALMGGGVTNVLATGGTMSTNRVVRRTRYGEADLARERREGIPFEVGQTGREEPERPGINDPALARALDLLKGLAVVRGK